LTQGTLTVYYQSSNLLLFNNIDPAKYKLLFVNFVLLFKVFLTFLDRE